MTQQHQHQQHPKSSTTATTVGDKLYLLRKEVFSKVDEIIKDVPDNQIYKSLKEDLVSTLDNFMGVKLVEGLKKKYGDCSFKVKMENYVTPFVSSSSKNSYRYILKHISWTGGPNPHQLFFYIKEVYKYYLKSEVYDEKMFTRAIPGIEKKYISYFIPYTIAGADFEPIEVFITKVVDKKEGKVIDVYYNISTTDDKMGIKDVTGRDLTEMFTNFQSRLEDLYYKEHYDEQHIRLMKKRRVDDNVASKKVNDINNNNNGHLQEEEDTSTISAEELEYGGEATTVMEENKEDLDAMYP